jgi:hypothetical protein
MADLVANGQDHTQYTAAFVDILGGHHYSALAWPAAQYSEASAEVTICAP